MLALLVWAVPAHATFPGEDGKLAFERSQLFTVNPDGSALTALTPAVGGISAREPAWSPDGRLIAFDHAGGPAGGERGWGIWVMNADGSNQRQITREPEDVATSDTYPTWSPDGTRIAFVRDRDLFVMNADGSGVQSLTATFDRSVDDPDWSPRGDQIAFSDGFDLYVMGADGTSPPQLIPTTTANQRYPSWSPDGTTIAYAQLNEVGRVNPDGSGETILVSGRREVWDVAWSPSGTRIAFIEDPGTDIQVQEELFMMNADGSGVRPLGVDTSTNLDWGVAAQGPPPPPVLGEAVNVGVVKGTVLIGIPADAGASAAAGVRARASQKGVEFVPLEEARQIPVGSFLDTREGTVRLTSARDRAARTQSGTFTRGLFQVLQSRNRRAKGLTELRLKGTSFRSCRARGSAEAQTTARRRRVIRRLRARARGRFRTRGRHSAATVRGTTWITADRCDGTLTTVKRGKVAVRDFRRKRTVIVRRGKSYLAAPRR